MTRPELKFDASSRCKHPTHTGPDSLRDVPVNIGTRTSVISGGYGQLHSKLVPKPLPASIK
eukprot:3944746-Pyramimonas_sp.AAC.1